MQTLQSMFQNLQNFRLDRLNLPRKRSFQFSDRVELAGKGIGVSQWVLSRAFCRFNRFDLSALPAAKRKAALALQLPQWSPYQNSDYAIVWQNGIANVWCWDATRVEAEIQKHGKIPKSQQRIPETVLRAPLQSGLRLMKCMDGVEGQYWQDGQLVTSRWWPQKPDQHAWLTFQRDCGIASELQEAASTLQNLPLLLQPWGKVDSRVNSAGDIPIAEAAMHGILALVLGVATVVLGLQHFQIDRAISQRTRELSSIKSKAGPVFAAREAALNALLRLKSIDAIEPYPAPLILMEAVAESLPKDSGVFVREWDMTGSTLKISINSSGPNNDGASYVQALEKSGRFADVQVVTEADPKLMTFSMTVLPVDAMKTEERKQ